MIFRRFERLIDAFREAPDEMPPTGVGAFYLHFLKQAWPAFALLLAVGLIGALIEVALFNFIGQIVDLMPTLRRLSAPFLFN